jgi:hypothetical protein
MLVQDFEEKIISRNSLNFKTNSAIININQEDSLVSLRWDSHTVLYDIKQSYQLAVDLAKRFGVRNWLSDARNVAYLNIETQNWLLRCIAPQLQQNNMHKLVRVVQDEPLAILTSFSVADKIAGCPELACKLNCEIFTDVDNALSWLNE